ncbi:PHP-associated domain-containing protein [Candidatus Hodarchaeum mangrovi]
MSQIDCHCHTKYSKCSNLEPKDLLKISRKKLLDGIVICDHGTNRGYHAFKSLLNRQDDFILIPGIEILTQRGELLALWIEDLPNSNSFPEIVYEIHDQGGIVVIPHPYDRIRKKAFKPKKEDIQYLNGIEVFNSRCLMPRGNHKALKFSQEHSLIQTAGSDAHFKIEIGNAGVTGDFQTSEDFRTALLKGEITVFGKLSPYRTHFYTIIHRINRSIGLYRT